MSDTYIPGVKSKYDTEKLIADLMKLERVRKDSAEKRIKTLETDPNVRVFVGHDTFNIIRLNPKRPPFDNPKVRQAMNYLIDRKEIVDLAWGGAHFLQVHLNGYTGLGHAVPHEQCRR